jgi:4-amino-4-deoxy-L-arabinose transferase-like glycosyltransferase
VAGAPRTRRAALGAILGLALAVRLAGLGDRLSHDEGYTWIVASAPSAGEFLDRLAAYENTPPLLYALLALLPLDDEAWLRLPVLVASVAQVAVLYAAVRALAGTRPALLAALALAVAPYHVSFANYSRAFMLAGLGVLLALWAAARLARGGRRRWWWLWAAGAVLALYSEYDAGLALAAIAAMLLWLGVPARRDVLALAPLPALTLLPWLPELLDAAEQLDETKVAPIYPGPGFGSLRDVTTALALGEHGAAGGAAARTAQFALIAAALALAGRHLWRRDRAAFALLAGTGLGTLALAGLAALAGPDVFAQRYLTVLIPLAAGVAGVGVDGLAGRRGRLPWRFAPAVAAAGLLLVGAAVFATRHGRELEPDPGAIGRAAESAGPPRELRTNSAVAAFYLRDLPVVLDRPFGLDAPPLRVGPAAACGARCGPPVAVDDTRVAGGARPGAGARRAIGPFVVQLDPR